MPPDNLAGKIKTVSVRDFVTYEECIFHPNEYLNVIIGPNGTGKSTLVAAIVIGLGGDPKLLNRSTAIKDYIKNGKDEATIAVRIYQNNSRENYLLFERKFNSAGKSEFKVGGEIVSKTRFVAAVENFKIQIGNLCQFLPQDRVHDFAKLNPQELFVNTIKSVCDQEEIRKFDELKNLRSEQHSRKDTLAQDTQNLRALEVRLDELNVVLERYAQRKEYLEKLKICDAKLLWMETKEIDTKLMTQLADKTEAEKLVKKVNREYNDVKSQQDAITQTKSNLRADAERKRAVVNKLLQETNDKTTQIEDLFRKIKSEKRLLEEKKREYDTTKEEILSDSAVLQAMTQDLSDIIVQCGTVDDINSEQHSLNEKLVRYRTDISKRSEVCRNINKQLDEEYTPPIQMLKTRIERAHNLKDKKKEMLRKNFPNVFTAMHWLEQNQSRFNGKVYNPLLLELNVKNPQYAKYTENTIPLRDLLAITCENKADMSLVINELCIKQQLGVNAVYSPPADACNFKSTTPIQNLSQYGFETYLIDTIEGPPSIMNYLCSNYNIHRIPIGTEEVSQYTESIPTTLRLYFGGNFRYECSISMYSGEASLMQNQIDGKQLLMSVDTSQVESMKKELSGLLRGSDALKNKCTRIQSEIKDIEVKFEDIQNEKRGHEKKLSRIREASLKLERQTIKINQLKNSLPNIPEEETRFSNESKRIIKDLLGMQKNRIKSLAEFQNALGLKKVAEIKIAIYNQQSENLESKLADINQRKMAAKQTYDNIMSAIKTTERKLKEKTIKAKEATNGRSPQDRQFPFKDEFRELPNTPVEIKEHINEFKARLDCMIEVDENAIKEHEDKMVEIQRLKNSIYEIQSQENDIQRKIEIKFNDWYCSIERIVDNLNQQFSGFMASMGFVGDVSLSRKECYDFDSYGIQIMVQYRKEVPLQALDRCRQSGGERAVAIAVYSLSLQHITHVPFRCVDEINQGMDSKNERKIFEMLVQETTKRGRSQYFFVTPKLLPGLVYNKRMMVHIVYNGKFVKSGGCI